MIFGKTNNFFSVHAIYEILKTIDLADKTERQHFVLLSLLYETGARVIEMTTVRIEDIDLTDTPHIKLNSMGTTREVPLSSQLTKLMEQHIKENDLVGNQKLFFTEMNISSADLCRRLRIYIKRVRINNPYLIPDIDTINGFRISRANHLYQAGLSIEDLFSILGHTSISQTKRYIGIFYRTFPENKIS